MKTRSAWDVTATVVLTLGGACIVLYGIYSLAAAYGDAFWWTALGVGYFVSASLSPSRREPEAALVLPNLFEDRRPVDREPASLVKRLLFIGAALGLAALLACGAFVWATADESERSRSEETLEDLLGSVPLQACDGEAYRCS